MEPPVVEAAQSWGLWKTIGLNVVVPLASAGLGAFGGAISAHIISKKHKYRENLINEIRNTNSAIMIVYSIVNSYITMKEQLVKPLKDSYDNEVSNFNKFKETQSISAAVETPTFIFHADFQTLPPTQINTIRLQEIAYEKISLNGKPLALIDALTNSIYTLKVSINQRNELIEEYAGGGPELRDKLLHFYFAHPDEHGTTNTNYPDCMEAIFSLTDDCIIFSKLLCEELTDHGNKLKEKYKKSVSQRDCPKINKTDFTDAETKGLIPNLNNYKSWETHFKKNNDDVG